MGSNQAELREEEEEQSSPRGHEFKYARNSIRWLGCSCKLGIGIREFSSVGKMRKGRKGKIKKDGAKKL